MTAREIIAAMGGSRTVATIAGVERNAVSQWYRIGIPSKYWPRLARAAIEREETKNITIEILERHTVAEAA